MNTNSAIVAATLCAAALTTSALSAQGSIELPSTANPTFELTDYEQVPFMQPNARVQMFYGASEVGTAPFVATGLSFRYDGPIPQVGAPGPFAIQQLALRIGTTSVAVPGADFAANLSQPLTEVFNGPWTYLPDPGIAFPHPWGDPNGSLTWTFTQPVPIVVPAGEWLVVDVTMVGNNIANFGFAHAMLDGKATTGGAVDGVTGNYGAGCAATVGGAAASAGVEGTVAPGAAHFLTGQNLGANAITLGLFGIGDQLYNGTPLPFVLPGTACSLLTSAELTALTLADATGAVLGAALPLVVPADPALNGMQLFEQLAALAPGANPFGIVFSDAVAVTLGAFAVPGDDYYMVAHDSDASAAFANVTRAFGYALKFTTL